MVTAVNFVTGDALLAQRVATYVRRIESLNVLMSDTPVTEEETDIYVVPTRQMAWLLDGSARPPTWLPVVAYGNDRGLRAAFLAGCRDYLREPWSMEEFSFRVARCVTSSTFQTEWGVVRLFATFASTEHGEVELSAQEHRILRVLLLQMGKPVPREVLYYALWGRTDTRSRVVDVHISSLRRKLTTVAGCSHSKQLIRSARGLGYLIPARSSSR